MHFFFSKFMIITGFPGGSEVKAMHADAGATGTVCSIPGLGRPPGGGNGSPLQSLFLQNPLDGGTWWATDHGAAKNVEYALVTKQWQHITSIQREKSSPHIYTRNSSDCDIIRAGSMGQLWLI